MDGWVSDDDEDGFGNRSKPAVANVAGGVVSKRGRPSQKCRMVDITSLLGMPQRQAAEVLGISESMLCKRYKECTKRKWPFRYLGKLEKKINAKNALLVKSGALSAPDRAALDALLREKAAILTPIQIRVTEAPEGSNGKRPKKSAAAAAEYDEMYEEERDEEDEGGDEEDEDEDTAARKGAAVRVPRLEKMQPAPPTLAQQTPRRRLSVFEDEGDVSDLNVCFNPASILLALSGGV